MAPSTRLMDHSTRLRLCLRRNEIGKSERVLSNFKLRVVDDNDDDDDDDDYD